MSVKTGHRVLLWNERVVSGDKLNLHVYRIVDGRELKEGTRSVRGLIK